MARGSAAASAVIFISAETGILTILCGADCIFQGTILIAAARIIPTGFLTAPGILIAAARAGEVIGDSLHVEVFEVTSIGGWRWSSRAVILEPERSVVGVLLPDRDI